jgi:hypothetical protein
MVFGSAFMLCFHHFKQLDEESMFFIKTQKPSEILSHGQGGKRCSELSSSGKSINSGFSIEMAMQKFG